MRRAIDGVHRNGQLKPLVKQDSARYIEKDPMLALTLRKLRSSGKKLFIVTNSHWDYTGPMMAHLLDGTLPDFADWTCYCLNCKLTIDISEVPGSNPVMQPPTDTRDQKIRLTAKACKQLRQWFCDPEVIAKDARRGRIIELLAQGASQQEARKATGAGIATVGRVWRRFLEEGLKSAVFGYVPSGRSKVLTRDDASRVVAIACSDLPKGRSAWTLQLIAEHAVSTLAVPAIGKEAV